MREWALKKSKKQVTNLMKRTKLILITVKGSNIKDSKPGKVQIPLAYLLSWSWCEIWHHHSLVGLRVWSFEQKTVNNWTQSGSWFSVFWTTNLDHITSFFPQLFSSFHHFKGLKLGVQSGVTSIPWKLKPLYGLVYVLWDRTRMESYDILLNTYREN